MKTIQLLAAGVAMVAVVAACYESPDVSLHEPGQYLGKTDPLVEKMKSEDFRRQLVDRFKEVQTDR